MNEYTLKQLQNLCPQWIDLKMEGNTLIYKGQSVDITGVSLQRLFTENFAKNPDISAMSPEDFFRLAKVHAAAYQQKNEKEEIETLKEVNPQIKNISIIEQKDELGNNKKYVHYIDEQGVSHILYKYAPTDILRVYKELFQRNQGKVTEKDLYQELERKMQNVELTSSYVMSDNNQVREEYQNELKNHEKNRTGSYALGNEEHNIIVSDNLVYTFTRDDKGNLIKQEQKSKQELETKEVPSSSTEEISKTEEQEIEKTLLISEEEFFGLLDSPNMYKEEEQEQLDLYYGFLFELMKYRDYLLADVAPFLVHYENKIYQLQMMKQSLPLNQNQEASLQKYQEMLENVQEQQYTKNEEEAMKRTLKQYPQRVGFINGLFIVISTAVGGMLLTLLLLSK